MPHNFEAGSEPEWPLMLRLSKVFADPQRVKILAECRRRPMSPRIFYEEFGGASLDRVLRDFDVLAQYDWIDPVGGEDGDVQGELSERLYSAKEGTVFREDDMAAMPGPVRTLLVQGIFESIALRVNEAVEAGTMEDRVDQHITWTPLTLDQLGWERVISKVDALFYSLAQEQREADSRIAESGAEPVPMTVALLAFESPQQSGPRPKTQQAG